MSTGWGQNTKPCDEPRTRVVQNTDFYIASRSLGRNPKGPLSTEAVEKRVIRGGRRGVVLTETVEAPADRLARAAKAGRSGSDRHHQWSDTEDPDHSLEVISQDVKAHLGSDLVEGPG